MTEREVFEAALELPPAERTAFLESACPGDAALRVRLEALLRQHDEAGSFLEGPAITGAFPTNAIPQEQVESVGMVLAGRYKLLEEIGEGGMGTVWMAQQTEPIKRLVAIKLIKPGMDSKQVLARFEAERQALALMDHPNIARVFDAGAIPFLIDDCRLSIEEKSDDHAAIKNRQSTIENAGRPYFVMELVKGVPITKYCDEHQLTPSQRLELFIPVCHAIQHAHQKGIIHRDIKPSNVLVALYDDRPVPKVIDFGVAKATGQQLTEATLHTNFGAVVGTVEYMSPEQASFKQLDVDTRSDIYSLGVLLYELLAGSPPFTKKELEKAGMLEMLRVIREQEPSKPSTKLSSSDALPSLSANRGTEPSRLTRLVRGELDWIVLKALEKDRTRRYETANGFAADVQRYLADEAVQACPPSVGYRFRKFTRRNKRALSGAAVLALAVLVVAGTLGWAFRDREARAHDAARDRDAQHATTAARVGQVLDESKDLYRLRKLPEATQLARNALALADGGAGGPEVERRAREWLNDLDLVVRLEEIHSRSDFHHRTDIDMKAKLGEYFQAFREYGIDIEALPPEEAASRIASRPIRVDLAVSLDRWIWNVKQFSKDMGLEGEKGVALRARLGQIARRADPDKLRNRLRDLYADGATPKPGDPVTRELAASVDLAATPITTLMLTSYSLEGREMSAFFTRVQQQHPGDFDVNYRLGYLLSISGRYIGGNPKDLDPAIAYLTAAVAIRPTNPSARFALGQALAHKGLVDEAVAAFREYGRLKPEEVLGSRLQIANALMKKKDRQQEALAMYRELVRADPNRLAFRHAFGEALRELGRTDEAIAEFREAIRIAPNGHWDYNWLGLALEDKGLGDDAIAAYREAIRLFPGSWIYRSNLGHAFRKKGALEEAIAAFHEAIRLDPERADTHNALGFALQKQGKLDEAIACYKKAIELDPKKARFHNDLGFALGTQGKLDEAIAAFRKAIELDPKVASFHNNLGFALREQGKMDEAIACCKKAIELDPKDAVPHHNLGVALQKQKKLDEAIAEYHKAIELDPKLPGVHINLGNALMDQKKLDEAIACYKKAIELEPKYAIAHCNLGQALQSKGELDEAIACYKKAIELEPKVASFHNNLGIALRKQGKLDEAIACYKKAIEINPTVAGYHINLGSALQQQGKLDEAIACFKKAIELDPNYVIAHDWLGTLLQKQGKLDEAIAKYREATRLKPDYAVAHYRLGVVLKELGRFDDAVLAYSKLIELEPNHARRLNELAWLLATTPELRHPAVTLAGRAIKLAPKDADYWNTLGVAQYRAGDWKEAIAALQKYRELRANDGEWSNPFFLAMAHWRLGNKSDARKWYDKGVEWMDKNQPENKELRRFRAEAAELLRVAVEVGPPPREKK